MDLSILVFFQRWLISNEKDMHSHGIFTGNSEGPQKGHPPDPMRQ